MRLPLIVLVVTACSTPSTLRTDRADRLEVPGTAASTEIVRGAGESTPLSPPAQPVLEPVELSSFLWPQERTHSGRLELLFSFEAEVVGREDLSVFYPPGADRLALAEVSRAQSDGPGMLTEIEPRLAGEICSGQAFLIQQSVNVLRIGIGPPRSPEGEMAIGRQSRSLPVGERVRALLCIHDQLGWHPAARDGRITARDIEVSAGPDDMVDGSSIWTPSGEISESLAARAQIVSRMDSGELVVGQVSRTGRTGRSAAITLANGQEVVVPVRHQLFVITNLEGVPPDQAMSSSAASTRGVWRRASELSEGMVIWGRGGVHTISEVTLFAGRRYWPQIEDVGYPNTYFANGILVRDFREQAPTTRSPFVSSQGPLTSEVSQWPYAECHGATRLHFSRSQLAGNDALGFVVYINRFSGRVGGLAPARCGAEPSHLRIARAWLDRVLAEQPDLDLYVSLRAGGCDVDRRIAVCGLGQTGETPVGEAIHVRSNPTCLAEGTLISTPIGNRPIEELRPGDTVLSWNPSTAQLVSSSVIRNTHRLAEVLRVRTADGHVIEATEEHVFYDGVGARFRSLEHFRLGDSLQILSSGDLSVGRYEAGHISRITAIEHTQAQRVYNLSLSAPHTYFANGILVHNY